MASNKTNAPKILMFDIECSNLAANFGFIFCIGYMFLGEKKPTILSLRDDRKSHKKDPTNDKPLIESFRPIVEGADVIVAHYGKKFDVPFLQTRAFEHGLKPFNMPTLIDTWFTPRYVLKFNSNRLDTISRSIPGQSTLAKKTPIDNKAWVRAPSGHIPSLQEVEKHCYYDILVLRDTYLAIRPFIAGHPHIGKLIDPNAPSCPACGSKRLQKHGIRATATTQKQRMRCLDCGHSYTLSMKEAGKI